MGINILMDNFFKDVDGFVMNNPALLAKEYLKYILDNPTYLCNKEHNAFFVTNNNNYLSEITKKCFLVSDGLSISCKSDKSIRFLVDYSEEKYSEGIGFFAFENNLEKLGMWLRDAKKLLIADQLSYYPNIYSYRYKQEEDMQLQNVNYISDITNVVDAMEMSKKVTGISKYYAHELLLSHELILKVDIPVINGARLSDFSDVVVENATLVEDFQKFMRRQLNCIDAGSLLQLKELGDELQARSQKIKESYEITISKYLKKFIYTIGFSTVKAMLYIIKPEVFELFKNAPILCYGWEWERLLEEGLNIKKQRYDYKNDECYFLWLLSEEKKNR